MPDFVMTNLRVIAGGGGGIRATRRKDYRLVAHGHRFQPSDWVELKDGRTGWIAMVWFRPGVSASMPNSVATMVIWTPQATNAEAHATFQHIWGKPRRGGSKRLNSGIVITPHDIARVFPKLPLRGKVEGLRHIMQTPHPAAASTSSNGRKSANEGTIR